MSEGKEPSSEWTTPTPRGRWTEKDKTIFRSVDKGFKLVENFEDGIRAFEFEQKQEKETVEKLRGAGFKYNSNRRQFFIQATPATRELSDHLAMELSGKRERGGNGMER